MSARAAVSWFSVFVLLSSHHSVAKNVGHGLIEYGRRTQSNPGEPNPIRETKKNVTNLARRALRHRDGPELAGGPCHPAQDSTTVDSRAEDRTGQGREDTRKRAGRGTRSSQEGDTSLARSSCWSACKSPRTRPRTTRFDDRKPSTTTTGPAVYAPARPSSTPTRSGPLEGRAGHEGGSLTARNPSVSVGSDFGRKRERDGDSFWVSPTRRQTDGRPAVQPVVPQGRRGYGGSGRDVRDGSLVGRLSRSRTGVDSNGTTSIRPQSSLSFDQTTVSASSGSRGHGVPVGCEGNDVVDSSAIVEGFMDQRREISRDREGD